VAWFSFRSAMRTEKVVTSGGEKKGEIIWLSIRTNSFDFKPLIIGLVSQKALMGRIIAFAFA
jgi:hypothetical protein